MLKKKFKVKYMVAKQMFGAKQKNNIFKCLGVGWVIFHWEGEDLFRLPPPPFQSMWLILHTNVVQDHEASACRVAP